MYALEKIEEVAVREITEKLALNKKDDSTLFTQDRLKILNKLHDL